MVTNLLYFIAHCVMIRTRLNCKHIDRDIVILTKCSNSTTGLIESNLGKSESHETQFAALSSLNLCSDTLFWE